MTSKVGNYMTAGPPRFVSPYTLQGMFRKAHVTSHNATLP